ncbi:TetR family transcriptional regulator [Heyndrickxia shackletonii]|uniref:TetR family transcriptional regulator n=1 Tax=Heyndrickxia shackletonii TaxID=157838 RepID=A0A0Q3WY03_9BACI|nr:TetR/AcrR family transcriptional regulator [Heyndrickxia shackletonii]KQL53971.1 TetR family transcriptional regulator [Heyndrickxia shackletonii]MBB2478867.1 TetR/AcrR family transcriptional regulator [Bacillus sp. APMAM]NEY97743.1 TetR/AcrR family transcriptional regulator [Heyndrickxia shackletonii]RTZ57617.1 TetR/AcrR family transcriptional regulator [Bacillus sp. SAJ1]
MSKKMDPRVIRTRQMLRDALVELICERGYEKITVQDIAKQAMLNRATFYLHYRDKFDLLYQSSEEILNDLTESINMSFEGKDEFDFLSGKPHRNFIHLFEQISLNSKLYKVFLTEKNMPHFTASMMDVLIDFISRGINIMQPNDKMLTVPRDIAVRYYASAFLGVIVWWLENDMPYTPTFMATQLMRLAIKGPYVDDPFI